MSKHVPKNASSAKSLLENKSAYPEKQIVFSFKDLDRVQGARIDDWVAKNIVSNLIERLHEFSKLEVPQALSKQFKIYGKFPEKTKFTHPAHVTKEANWAAFHIQGKEVVAGHVIGNIFFVVFWDSDHGFWLTEKKHT